MLDDIKTDCYFKWLVGFVSDAEHDTNEYTTVLARLYSEAFYWSVEHDENRASDGVALRDRFCQETQLYPNFWLPDYCSVLEMLVALSIRMEDSILYDREFGDRTSKWFWIMMDNLGLSIFTNDEFYDREYRRIVRDFLDRTYEPDGTGGLFYSYSAHFDMRKVEIWYQMDRFVDEFLLKNE